MRQDIQPALTDRQQRALRPGMALWVIAAVATVLQLDEVVAVVVPLAIAHAVLVVALVIRGATKKR